MINTMNLLSAGVELFAASIMAILLLGCWEERQYRTKTNRLFVAILSIQTLLLIGDSAIWLLLNEPTPGKIPLVKTLTLITDIMTVVLSVVYTYFLFNFISQKKPISFVFPHAVSAICGVVILLWIFCLFNDWYIWYDADGNQIEGPLYKLIWLLGTLLLQRCHAGVPDAPAGGGDAAAALCRQRQALRPHRRTGARYHAVCR